MGTSCNRSRPARRFAIAVLGGALALLAVGCATSGGVSDRQPDIDRHPVVAGNPPTVYRYSMVRIRRVAREAMQSMNCTMVADAPSYLKGQLPSREFVEVFMRKAGDKETHLWVDTTRTFIGGAYQANRDREMLNAIERALDRDLMLHR